MERAAEKTGCMPDGSNEVSFEDLFDLKDIQRIQDEFSSATGVASIITRPDGTPITSQSNFTQLCCGIIRKTEKGRTQCFHSDAIIGRHHPEGPIVQPCLSAGLWDAGASITVGGRHIANWLIGQVRNESQSDENMRAYAREIGADEEEFMEAFARVPTMSEEHFKGIAQALFTLANQLSLSAYQNMQQARLIAEQQKAEEVLSRNREELRTLTVELSLAEQREQQRIAAELHDGVSQFLSSALLQLNVLQEKPEQEESVADALEKIGGIIEQTLRQTRTLTFELNFPSLSQLGLAAALEELCTSMTHEHAICFDFIGDTQPLELPLNQQLVLYRSVRELLINVAKHSEAQSVQVTLKRGDCTLQIIVKDDGKGFDAASAGEGFSPSGGFGLFNLREYLRHAGGTLQIDSAPDVGTEVELTVPLPADCASAC